MVVIEVYYNWYHLLSYNFAHNCPNLYYSSIINKNTSWNKSDLDTILVLSYTHVHVRITDKDCHQAYYHETEQQRFNRYSVHKFPSVYNAIWKSVVYFIRLVVLIWTFDWEQWNL